MITEQWAKQKPCVHWTLYDCAGYMPRKPGLVLWLPQAHTARKDHGRSQMALTAAGESVAMEALAGGVPESLQWVEPPVQLKVKYLKLRDCLLLKHNVAHTKAQNTLTALKLES